MAEKVPTDGRGVGSRGRQPPVRAGVSLLAFALLSMVSEFPPQAHDVQTRTIAII